MKLIPICVVPDGFAPFVEAEIFDSMHLAVENGATNISLKNSQRPVRNNYNIYSTAVIYKWVDTLISQNYPIYGGSTCELFDRYSNHKSDCFTKKINKKLYEYFRKYDENFLAPNLKMRAVFICPIGMKFELEKKYINDNNLINDGLNNATVKMTKQEKKEKLALMFKNLSPEEKAARREGAKVLRKLVQKDLLL